MDKELAGKTALVTGASRGIGAATAILLARNGVERMIVHFNSHRTGIEETVAAIKAEGVRADAIQADFTKVDGIHAFVDKYRQLNVPIDILVNNAGSLVKRVKLLAFNDQLFDQVMNLNVRSLWSITQVVAGGMVERRSGCIVNVSSIAARHGGGPGATVYAAAKAAVSAITKGVAKELAPHGIRVNAVSPGTVDNFFHEQFSTPQMLDAAVKSTPAGTLGSNEEIADTIFFLCSNGARHIHGQTIEVNGGMLMV